MTFHISEIALNPTCWAGGLLSFHQHQFHPVFKSITFRAQGLYRLTCLCICLCPPSTPPSLSISPPTVAGDGARRLKDSNIQDSQGPAETSYQLSPLDKKKKKGNKIRPKVKALLSWSLWSCHFLNTKLLAQEFSLFFFKDQTKGKTFQSLLPENILLHATLSSVLTVVMRTNILQCVKRCLHYDSFVLRESVHVVFLFPFDKCNVWVLKGLRLFV